jgi:hypothetical protein
MRIARVIITSIVTLFFAPIIQAKDALSTGLCLVTLPMNQPK